MHSKHFLKAVVSLFALLFVGELYGEKTSIFVHNLDILASVYVTLAYDRTLKSVIQLFVQTIISKVAFTYVVHFHDCHLSDFKGLMLLQLISRLCVL